MIAPRVCFTERQTLTARDLSDEQAYLLALGRRHSLGPHHWGIVFGLDLTVEEGGDARIAAGMAVDGYGRELLLPAPVVLQAKHLDPLLQDRDLLVSLRYAREPLTVGYGGRHPCGPGEHDRWREEAPLYLTRVTRDSRPDPRHPPGAPLADVEADPTGDLPDDPARVWPVLLGLLTWTDEKLKVDSTLRPYVGLVGETVRAASGRSQLTLGERIGSGGTRFAVTLPDAHGSLTDIRLSIDSPGQTTVRGTLTLDSELRPGTFPGGDSPPPGTEPLVPTALLFPPNPPVSGSPQDGRSLHDRVSDLIIADYSFQEGDVLDPWCLALRLRRCSDPSSDPSIDTLCRILDSLDIVALDNQGKPISGKDLLDWLKRLADAPTRPPLIGVMPVVLMALNALIRATDRHGQGVPKATYSLVARGPGAASHLVRMPRPDEVQGLVLRPATRRLGRELQQLAAQRVAVAGTPSAETTVDALAGERAMLYNRLLLEDLFPDELRSSANLPGAWGLAFRPLTAFPRAALPWRVYRVNGVEKDAPIEEMRLEIADPSGKGDPALSRVAIGRWQADDASKPNEGRFRPCLVVDATCTVTVCGDLTVEGAVIQGPDAADADASPGAGQAPPPFGQGAGLNPELNLTIDIQSITATAGQPWSYSVTITNPNAQALGPIGLYEAVAVDAQPLPVPTPLVGLVPQLGPNATSQTIQVSHAALAPNTATHTLSLAVTVVGVAPPSGAYGSASQNTTIA